MLTGIMQLSGVLARVHGGYSFVLPLKFRYLPYRVGIGLTISDCFLSHRLISTILLGSSGCCCEACKPVPSLGASGLVFMFQILVAMGLIANAKVRFAETIAVSAKQLVLWKQ